MPCWWDTQTVPGRGWEGLCHKSQIVTTAIHVKHCQNILNIPKQMVCGVYACVLNLSHRPIWTADINLSGMIQKQLSSFQLTLHLPLSLSLSLPPYGSQLWAFRSGSRWGGGGGRFPKGPLDRNHAKSKRSAFIRPVSVWTSIYLHSILTESQCKGRSCVQQILHRDCKVQMNRCL